LTLAVALPKGDRQKWLVEKATELGVNRIVPLAAARSEKGLLTAAGKRAERWKRILFESSQQSRRVRLPVLETMMNSEDAFAASGSVLEVMLSERSDAQPLKNILHDRTADSVALAIGPEGGWTSAEFTVAAECGFAEAALGSNILRTETAVCAALAAAQYSFGAFRQTPESSDSSPDSLPNGARAIKEKGSRESSDE